jgi:flagellin
MTSMINTNMAALNAQRNLSMSQSSLTTSLQRLSSGLRINSAKDDAAGLSIASRMSAQIGGLQQAQRNANDAISMSQTAEGAMSEVNNMLLRMRDLSVEAANGTNSDLDRQTIQNEVDQLTSEIDRVSGSTEFNGNKLLNGTLGTRSFQVGADAGQTISFTVSEVSVKAMGLNSTSALGDLNSGRVSTSDPATGDLVINGVSITLGGAETTAALKRDAINAQTGQTNVTATAYNSLQGTAGATGVTDGTAANGFAIAVNGGTAVTIAATTSLNDLVDKINQNVGGVTASIGNNGGLSLTNTDGASITVSNTAGTGMTAGTYQGYLSLKSGDGSAITLSTATGTASTALNSFGFNGTVGNSAVSSAGLLSTAAASDAAAVVVLDATQGKLLSTDNVKINGYSVGVTGSSAAEKVSAINAIKDKTGVTATATTQAFVDLQGLASTDSFTINGTTITLAATDTDTADVVSAITAAGISGITASADATTGRLVLTSSGGNDIVIGNGAGGGTIIAGVATTASGTATATAASQSIAIRGVITLTGDSGSEVRLEEGVSGSLAKLGLVDQGGNAAAVGGKLDVKTAANANNAITRIDAAIQFIATQRSTMGAIQNRFQSSISNLMTSAENITAARSRIQDADFASETANLTRSQILQQAGTAMLAQANSLPNGVLSLLRG